MDNTFNLSTMAIDENIIEVVASGSDKYTGISATKLWDRTLQDVFTNTFTLNQEIPANIKQENYYADNAELISWYGFEENFKDFAGNKEPAVESGENIVFTDGIINGSAIKFNGKTNSKIRFTYDEYKEVFQDNFSIAFFIISGSDNNDDVRRRIVEYSKDSKTFSLIIGDDNDNHNLIFKTGDGDNVYEVNTGININDTFRHHLIVEFKKGTWRITLDDISISTGYYEHYREDTYLDILLAGTGSNEQDVGFIGQIDDFRIFRNTFKRTIDRNKLFTYRPISLSKNKLNRHIDGVCLEFNRSTSANLAGYDAIWFNKEFADYRKNLNNMKFSAATYSDHATALTFPHMIGIDYYEDNWAIDFEIKVIDKNDDKIVFTLNDHPDVDTKYKLEITQKYDSDNDILYLYGEILDSDGNSVIFSEENDPASHIEPDKYYRLTMIYKDKTISFYNNELPVKEKIASTAKTFHLDSVLSTLGGRILKNEKYNNMEFSLFNSFKDSISLLEMNHLHNHKLTDSYKEVFKDLSEIAAYFLNYNANDEFNRYNGEANKIDYEPSIVMNKATYAQDDSYIKLGKVLETTPDEYSISIWFQTNSSDSMPLIYEKSGKRVADIINGKLVIFGNEIDKVINDSAMHNLIITSDNRIILDEQSFGYYITDNSLLDEIWLGYDGDKSFKGSITIPRFFRKAIIDNEIKTIINEGF